MAMNLFRFLGDLLHTIAICMVLHRLLAKKNAQGVSRVTQELLLFVSLTRYLDLLTTFYSVYNSMMKLFYIGSSSLIVWSMRFVETISSTYRTEHDSMNKLWLLLPCLIVTLVLQTFSNRIYVDWSNIEQVDLMEAGWTFSILLESVALLPQAVMFRRYRRVENLTGGTFLLMMGIYRGLYLCNWVYRAHTERHYRHHYLVYACAVLQVLVGIGGLFWKAVQDTDDQGDDSATAMTSPPLWPQLVQMYREVHYGWIFSLVALLMLVIFQGVDSYYAHGFHYYYPDDRQNHLNLLMAVTLIPLLLAPFFFMYILIVHYDTIIQIGTVLCNRRRQQQQEGQDGEAVGVPNDGTEMTTPLLEITTATTPAASDDAPETNQTETVANDNNGGAV